MAIKITHMKINVFLWANAFALCALSLISCRKDRDLSYQGPSVVELNNPITGLNSKLMGQSIGGGSLFGDNPNISIKGDRDSVLVLLVGPQRDAPVNINYEIQGQSAIEGEDYEIIGEPGVVTIPANSSSTAIYFRLLNDEASPSANKRLTVLLLGTDQSDVSPSTNYSSFVVDIFPMRSYLNRQMGSPSSYFSTANGMTYSSDDAASSIDFHYSLVDGTPTLQGTSGRPTLFSGRVFAPPSSVPSHLQQSYVTLQLNSVTSTSLNSVPTSGTTAAAIVNESVAVTQNGVYAFLTADGKKGYIRIQDLTEGTIRFDVMFQP